MSRYCFYFFSPLVVFGQRGSRGSLAVGLWSRAGKKIFYPCQMLAEMTRDSARGMVSNSSSCGKCGVKVCGSRRTVGASSYTLWACDQSRLVMDGTETTNGSVTGIAAAAAVTRRVCLCVASPGI